MIKPGFWTNGFVKDPSKNMVFWNDMKDDIISELWAEAKNTGAWKGRLKRFFVESYSVELAKDGANII